MQPKQLQIQIFYLRLSTYQNNFVKGYPEVYLFCGCWAFFIN